MKRLISIVLVVMLLLTMYPVAYGASVTASLATSSTPVEPGQIATITLNLSNIDIGEGIMSIGGELSYDTNVFEEIVSSDRGVITSASLSKITPSSGWGAISYNSNNKKFAMDVSGEAIASAGPVFEIKLKVKENVSNTESTVSISNLTVSDGFDEAVANTASAKVVIGEKAPADGGDDNTNNPPPVENIVENTVENVVEENTTPNIVVSTNTTNNTDKTVTTKKIPNAGVAYGIIISIAVVGIVVAVSYKKYSSMKDIK